MRWEDSEMLKESGMEVETTLTRFMDNEELYVRSLKKFLEDPSYQKLLQAMETEDYDEIHKAAHTLKGVTANLGLKSICDVATTIVTKIRSSQFAGLSDDMKLLSENYEKICEVIRKYTGSK